MQWSCSPVKPPVKVGCDVSAMMSPVSQSISVMGKETPVVPQRTSPLGDPQKGHLYSVGGVRSVLFSFELGDSSFDI